MRRPGLGHPASHGGDYLASEVFQIAVYGPMFLSVYIAENVPLDPIPTGMFVLWVAMFEVCERTPSALGKDLPLLEGEAHPNGT